MDYFEYFDSLISYLEKTFPKEKKEGLSIYHSGGGNFHYHMEKENFYMIINPLDLQSGDSLDVTDLSNATNQKVCCTFDDNDFYIQHYFESDSLQSAMKKFYMLCEKYRKYNFKDKEDRHLITTFSEQVQKHDLFIEHSGGGYSHYCLAKNNFDLLINPSDEEVEDILGLTDSKNQEVVCTFRSAKFDIQEPFSMPSLDKAIEEWYKLMDIAYIQQMR